ncbi:RNA 2',3'-cyclic phosphodiesterase [Nguyenibacter vanlangensis]|uniref:RNA 2',3'-cyclic phosphodiesterase n=1 Tax=Nguyenibacter vanlangensis TaxID=1216886 RepID=A0A7Y7M553_9PROT|nr:RNA 2',3'-cyclic phosphodiesterase [Nguyenibacter vanlangensis]NVN10642.1 RNA 2',3'-cyclic phosphodiesterase [Nguyenibacter vanlangensis]
MRLFVAFEIGPPLRDAMAALRGSLGGVRWTEPETYHLTLRFIGEVRERARQEEIHHALAAIRAPSCLLVPEGPGLFAHGEGRDTLWIGIARTDALMHLQRKIDTALTRAGIAIADRRKFIPHVTIGTLPRQFPETTPPAAQSTTHSTALSAWMARWGATPLPPLEAAQFTLYRSVRGAGQPVYVPLADYDFGQ